MTNHTHAVFQVRTSERTPILSVLLEGLPSTPTQPTDVHPTSLFSLQPHFFNAGM
jgi:hypothetical protein